MLIWQLEAEGGAAWRAYCKLRDAADHSLAGSLAQHAFAQAHAAITDPENPEGFERFVRAAEAEEEAAAEAAATAVTKPPPAPAAPTHRMR